MPKKKLKKKRLKKILSIDGGGIRGVIPAVIIRELERLTGKRMSEMFDLIAGTSTGGFLSLLLTKPGPDGNPLYSGDDVVKLYVEHGKDMFSRSEDYKSRSGDGALLPKYPSESVLGTLESYLNKGGKTELRDALTDVLITAYDLEQRKAFYFMRCKALDEEAENYYMVDVARATTAFPTLFPGVEINNVAGSKTLKLVDGGLVAVNPSTLALAEAIKDVEKNQPGYSGKLQKVLLVSLGTGKYNEQIPFDQAKDWGLQGWAPHLVDVLFDGSSVLIHDATEEICKAMNGESSYFRFQARLDKGDEGTDNVDPKNISALIDAANGVIQSRQSDFQKLKSLLLDEKGHAVTDSRGGFGEYLGDAITVE